VATTRSNARGLDRLYGFQQFIRRPGVVEQFVADLEEFAGPFLLPSLQGKPQETGLPNRSASLRSVGGKADSARLIRSPINALSPRSYYYDHYEIDIIKYSR
jgi:hypothetical protein